MGSMYVSLGKPEQAIPARQLSTLGTQRESLPLLCTRHATSKITSFSDLSRLRTYGFRGEALASISYACRLVTVITKRKGDLAGWK